jgi:hypothetical protein
MHAVLITAYKDFPSLERLATRLDRGFFKLYVHVDDSGSIGRGEVEQLKRLGASVTREHSIRWGAMAHLHAIIDLLREATSAGGVDYIHIISGQDYPLADVQEFEARCDGRIFMNFERVSEASNYIQDRCELRNLLYFLQTGGRAANRLHRYLDGPSRWLQQRLGLRRTRFGPFDALYKGIVWMSFPAVAAEQLLGDPVAADFLRALRTMYVPEEVFFQTYFLNSDMRESIVNDDLRYTDWVHRNGSVPAFLDESDLEALMSSGALFARKMNSETSARLLDAIDATKFDDGPAVRRSNERL